MTKDDIMTSRLFETSTVSVSSPKETYIAPYETDGKDNEYAEFELKEEDND